jgi:6,7-dimethyl-8-ribityllumazine synthase
MTTSQPSVLIIEARFYSEIADELIAGATALLQNQDIAFERFAVPGALEIPIALSIALKNRVVGEGARNQGCIALGCVIRGETSHYDIVAGESAAALIRIASDNALPLGNGILTVETREQALARASAEGKNKGRDAAAACLSLMGLFQDRPDQTQ